MIILELQDRDSKAFEEIFSILRCHPEILKYELSPEPVLSFPGLEIYPGHRKVFLNQQEIRLTVKEYEILLLLAANQGRVLSYRQIYEKVWGDFTNGNESNVIGYHICNLRAKLNTASANTAFRICSVREVGYCFEVLAESKETVV